MPATYYVIDSFPPEEIRAAEILTLEYASEVARMLSLTAQPGHTLVVAAVVGRYRGGLLVGQDWKTASACPGHRAAGAWAR